MCSRCTLFHDIGTRDFRDVLDMTVFVAVLICWIPFAFLLSQVFQSFDLAEENLAFKG